MAEKEKEAIGDFRWIKKFLRVGKGSLHPRPPPPPQRDAPHPHPKDLVSSPGLGSTIRGPLRQGDRGA